MWARIIASDPNRNCDVGTWYCNRAAVSESMVEHHHLLTAWIAPVEQITLWFKRFSTLHVRTNIPTWAKTRHIRSLASPVVADIQKFHARFRNRRNQTTSVSRY